ncbi:DeoR/GlpR family DNA-binding transcription regulator [uncultured Oscillibacter sp.]|uniref:DeoR/GlpR family DNA-binding transcription regulator n=1 Tax=uncultured Oscillibacter sp. TaxID=876091 RepID=UPI0025E74CBA|nr:DeoR/GlpR family DNA-binding transcription regulator [uncultured Oscillibacter sp.]
MLAEQRAERILRELAQRRAATVTDLCQVTGASEATIRRDLNALAKQGKLSKVHGGAMLMTAEFLGEELDMETKRQLRTEEKDRAARYAAGLIRDDDVVFLDAGTTILRMAEHLPSSKALFLTNSIECACRLMERNLRTHVLGGMLKAGTMALIGAETLEALRRYNFTKAFLGVNGVTVAQGFTTPDPEEAAVKSLAAERAQTVYVLADSSKFGQVTAAVMFPIEAACIITDRLPDQRYRDYTDIREV